MLNSYMKSLAITLVATWLIHSLESSTLYIYIYIRYRLPEWSIHEKRCAFAHPCQLPITNHLLNPFGSSIYIYIYHSTNVFHNTEFKLKANLAYSGLINSPIVYMAILMNKSNNFFYKQYECCFDWVGNFVFFSNFWAEICKYFHSTVGRASIPSISMRDWN